MRDAAGELDDLEAAGDLAERVGDDLAVLGGEDRGELVLAGVEDLAEREQHLLALAQRRVGPAGECGLGGLHGDVDVGRRGEAHLARTTPLAGL